MSNTEWFTAAPLLLYFVLSPLYFFPSGTPQIADFVIVLGVLMMFIKWCLHPSMRLRTVYFVGGLFALYTVGINVVNHFFFPDPRFLLSALYYPFNFLVFLYAATVFERNGTMMRNAAAWAILASVALEVFWAFFMPATHWRETGSFNNPNQLAYWSLLSATILVMLRAERGLSYLELGAIGVLGLLQTMALSKAGIITYSLFLFVLFFSPYLSNGKRILLSIGAAVMLVAAIFYMEVNLTEVAFIDQAYERVTSIGQEADDTPEARGYGRLIEFPEYVLLGAGEGAFARFDAAHVKELHSGLATIIFSYGIIGTLFFLTFFLLIYNKRSIFVLALFAPIILFGVSGQNFRFSHFWIYLAVVYACTPIQKPLFSKRL